MNKIVTPEQAIKIRKKIRTSGKTIVVAGGIFDILHLGHIRFLQKAKKHGDFLFVLLESDENAKRKKGNNRPIHTQKYRAFVLSSLEAIDYVITLPEMTKNSQYDRLINQLAPNVIAATKGDRENQHKERQAEIIGSKVEYVVGRIENQSTTRLEKIIKSETKV